MPSLAITKRDIPFGDFGEITLIGDKGMIDPRKSRANEVFSRDAYTVRKPVVNYEEPAKIDSDTFHKKYEETRKFFKKNSIDVGEINFSFQSLKQLEDEGKQKIRVKTCQAQSVDYYRGRRSLCLHLQVMGFQIRQKSVKNF